MLILIYHNDNKNIIKKEINMEVSSIIKTAKGHMKKNLSINIVVYLLYAIIITGANIVPGAGLVLAGPMAVCVGWFFMMQTRGKDVEFKNAYEKIDRFINAIVAWLFKSIFIFLFTFLFIVPGIIKYYSYSMTYYIIADDKDISGLEAIKKSKEMMKGRKMDRFMLDLSFIGWYILSMFTFGLAYFYAAPYHALAKAEFYRVLVGDNVVEINEEETIAIENEVNEFDVNFE